MLPVWAIPVGVGLGVPAFLLCLYFIWTRPECCLFICIYHCCGGGKPTDGEKTNESIAAGRAKFATAKSALSYQFRDRDDDHPGNGRYIEKRQGGNVVRIKVTPAKADADEEGGSAPASMRISGDYHPNSKNTDARLVRPNARNWSSTSTQRRQNPTTGNEIVSLDGSVSWGKVTGDSGGVWKLESGRTAKKSTEGQKWRWKGAAAVGAGTGPKSVSQKYAEHRAGLDGEVVDGPNGKRYVPNRVLGIKATIANTGTRD
jgi:hypothetical protein